MILFKQGLLYEMEQTNDMNNATASVSASTVGVSTTVSTNAFSANTNAVSANANAVSTETNVSVGTITASMVNQAKANHHYDDFDEYENMTRKFASYRRNMYDEEEYYRDAGDYDHDSDWN